MSFQNSKLTNGINVVTFNMPYVNSVSINIIVKVGSRYESEQESGISHFLEHMAFKGTKTRSAEKIAEEFAIGFAEWCFKKYNIISCYDMQELLKIYKKENKL